MLLLWGGDKRRQSSDIAKAQGGMARIAKLAGIQRESLYRALSARGNPRLSTLRAVAKAVGLRLTVEAAWPFRHCCSVQSGSRRVEAVTHRVPLVEVSPLIGRPEADPSWEGGRSGATSDV